MDVALTGGTGYLGTRLAQALLARGHRVRLLVRAASRPRVPRGAEALVGDALDADDVARVLAPSTTLVHLVGTPHPRPSKAAQFRAVDLPSIRASCEAARRARIAHLVYVSVAQPAPVMRAYVEVRAQGERLVAASGVPATVLRPWYVTGPGHRWPVVLMPLYACAARIPGLREPAARLGLVTLAQMVGALVDAVEHPVADAMRIVDVAAIRNAPPVHG